VEEEEEEEEEEPELLFPPLALATTLPPLPMSNA